MEHLIEGKLIMTNKYVKTETWEDFIVLNSQVSKRFSVLPRAADEFERDSRIGDWESLDYADALDRDVWP